MVQLVLGVRLPDRNPRRSPTAEQRFWAKVNKTETCWLWTDSLSEGYGWFGNTTAHRFAYELLVGPIPEGLQIDHQCHNVDLSCPGGVICLHRRCVNPDHLAPATPKENCDRSNQKARRQATVS